jgi:hypothetical protein
MDEGLKVDEKLKAENAKSGPANPQMQSATFNPAA